MNITPVTKTANACIEKLQKEGRVIINSLTQPTGKIGSWTYRGYGAPQEALISNLAKNNSLKSINYVV